MPTHKCLMRIRKTDSVILITMNLTRISVP